MMGKNHINRELLLRYAMSEVPIYSEHEETKLAVEDVRYVERHLQECGECRQQLGLLKDAVETGDQLLAKILETHFHHPVTPVVKPRKFPRKTWGWVLAPVGFAVVAFFLFPTTIRQWINPSVRGHASVENELSASVGEVTRGVSAVNQGANRFVEGNYSGAIESFRKAATSNESGDRGLAYLNIGLTFLAMAEHRQLGLFYQFDPQLADSALAYFAASLPLTTLYPRMQDTAFYFSAKAHLMREDLAAARESLDACIAIGGEKSEAAQKLLMEVRRHL